MGRSGTSGYTHPRSWWLAKKIFLAPKKHKKTTFKEGYVEKPLPGDTPGYGPEVRANAGRAIDRMFEGLMDRARALGDRRTTDPKIDWRLCIGLLMTYIYTKYRYTRREEYADQEFSAQEESPIAETGMEIELISISEGPTEEAGKKEEWREPAEDRLRYYVSWMHLHYAGFATQEVG